MIRLLALFLAMVPASAFAGDGGFLFVTFKGEQSALS
jgi:hypothetical protein